MKVKICGITNLDDAVCVCEAGADYLGLAFYPKSPRYINYQQAAKLIKQIRQEGWDRETGPVVVGLFVEGSSSTLNKAAAEAGVDILQLHGNYQAEDLANLAFPYFLGLRPRTLKAFRTETIRYVNNASDSCPAWLVDTYVPGAWGGTGQIGDWKVAAEICLENPRTLLAGGLTPENVGAAIQQVLPWGVDVSGGVESGKGIKDHQAVRAFVTNAKQSNG